MRSSWSEEWMIEEEGERPRGRDEDSSVQSQYEDSVLPDREFEHEEES